MSRRKKSWLRRHRWHVVSGTLAGCVVALCILGWTAYQQGELLMKVIKVVVGELR